MRSLALDRIAKGARTGLALLEALKDQNPDVVKLAQLALRRFQLVQTFTKRLHIVTSNFGAFVRTYIWISFDSRAQRY